MKKTFRISLLIISALFLTVAFVNGQDKKEQKKVKIIMSEGGKKSVIIDTTFTGTDTPDSIILKDGNTVYINSDDVLSDEKGNPGINKKISIRVTSSGENDKELSEGITVITDAGDADVKDSKTGKTYAYVISDKKSSGNPHKRIEYYIDKKEDGSSADMSNYVIAKDGVVITIEGANEDKVKEIASFIEDRMGVKKDKKTPKK